MALYLGDKLLAPMVPNNRPWWSLAKNPKFLYESNYQCSLASGTDYATRTPSSTQQSVYFTNPSYGSAAQTAIIDRWGEGYHNGTALDFQTYDYYVLADYLIDIAYIDGVNEATWGRNHALKYTCTSILLCYRSYSINGETAIYGNPNNNTLTASYFTPGYRVWYRNASNVFTSVASTYGFYITPGTIVLSQTNITKPVSFISFRTPYLYFRSGSSYHDQTAFIDNGIRQVDENNTTFKMRQRLYQAEKSFILMEEAINRQAYIYNNNDFPTESI